MKTNFVICLFIVFAFSALYAQPVALHPDNPHYFIYKGKPRIFITSAEHYGALMNLDFNYQDYLKSLHEEGMDYTRIFTGSYVENAESFGIEKNTLAPPANKLITPWVRSNTEGYVNGGNKFDLEQWDKAYFDRLNDFLQIASDYGIIVEITLFSSIYKEGYWLYSPLHPNNNINHTDRVERQFVNTLSNGNIFGHQEAMVRKIVRAVNTFDNVIFEIQNEPWADQPGIEMPLNKTVYPKEELQWYAKTNQASEASLAWQKEIARIIKNEESQLPNKHLIAQNYCNYGQSISQIDPNIGILNFHYVWPMAVHHNYGYSRPISFDESGFTGGEVATYRRQAWRFILAGGAVFNNLDYSFVAGHEDGSFVENHSPGLGNPELRRQLLTLKKFMAASDFINMKPSNQVMLHAPGFYYQVLGHEAKAYILYFEGHGNCEIKLQIPNGQYTAEWIEPETGKSILESTVTSKKDILVIETPSIEIDMALRIRRTK